MKIRNDNRAMLFDMLIAAGLAVVMLFAILTIGTYINGQISSSLVESFGEATERTALENLTVGTLENISAGFSNTIEVTIVAAIIVVITLPLMAIVAIKKIF